MAYSVILAVLSHTRAERWDVVQPCGNEGPDRHRERDSRSFGHRAGLASLATSGRRSCRGLFRASAARSLLEGSAGGADPAQASARSGLGPAARSCLGGSGSREGGALGRAGVSSFVDTSVVVRYLLGEPTA